ncbi:hypothetical protein RMSM_07090 [Rhodopirellula maiorica SM1]|uniref:Glycosyltransferase family 61 protein n=1 Tax=Rhodopirellula maiorica SM1 TaxID=1265738 RepID=M5RPS6_9BACT|nr:hypothetical protein RMSM_07090 [Rhodopirellula maiorica SM1]
MAIPERRTKRILWRNKMQREQNQSTQLPCQARPTISLANRFSALKHRLQGKPNVRPIGAYPSSIIDSQGCEFGYEMFYHVPYAYHLAKIGCLQRTVSCLGTECFYFFSPDHHERYDRRQFVKYMDSIAQQPHESPDANRWEPPNFAVHYRNKIELNFPKPLLLVFNKYNIEWDHPPINFLSKPFLDRVVQKASDRFSIVYLRPTSHIVHDHMPVGNLNEKEQLREQGVVLAEELYENYRHISFNEFQLCLLANSQHRISVQGGAAYMNALFPGQLMLLHRYGGEQLHGNYVDFPRMGVTDFTVHNNEFDMLDRLDYFKCSARNAA